MFIQKTLLTLRFKVLKMEDKYLNDIAEIKKMMSKSSQFISLSGLSGILAGLYALVGAFVAKYYINEYDSYASVLEVVNYQNLILKLFLIALSVLIASIVTSTFFTFAKANKQQQQRIWNDTSRRLLTNFLIPIATGGIFVLLLIKNQYYGLVAPSTLIFYGLSCVNASKYTLRDVRYLGLTIVVIGLFATYFIGYGLEFWALGFGICHIIYGSVMYFKYDRNEKK